MVVRPSRIVAVALVLAMPVAVANCSRILFGIVNAPAHIGQYERHASIAYGTSPRQTLDVYAPSAPVPMGARQRPVIVFWYGGVWIRGAKEQYRFVGAALANAGYVAVLPDYRLYPNVRFPRFVEDGALAVKWVHAHAAEFGGDPNAVFLMGHSAGAHLAATLALDPRYLRNVGGDPSWVRAWIGLSGPYAIERQFPIVREIFPEAMGAARWQPVSLVNGRSPAALLIHGTEDYLVHPRDTVELERRLRAAGVHVECRIYAGASHFDTVSALSVPLRFTAPSLADVRAFVDGLTTGSAETSAESGTPCPELNLRRDWESPYKTHATRRRDAADASAQH